MTENICGSLTNPPDPHKEEKATPSPAPSSWLGGARWRTEGNNYRLVITSSLNGFPLISDGFTSNLKVITCNLSGFSLWGRRRGSGGACRGEVSPLSATAMENSHVLGPARNKRAFSSSQQGPGHSQQPHPRLVTSTIQGTLRWQLRGESSVHASLLGAMPTHKSGCFRAASQQN